MAEVENKVTGNSIQIKRGKGTPPDNSLMEYELGYDYESSNLYIGVKDSEGKVVARKVSASGDSGLIYIGPDEPTDEKYSLWIDTDDNSWFGPVLPSNYPDGQIFYLEI